MARYIIVVVAMATAISLLAQQISSIKFKARELFYPTNTSSASRNSFNSFEVSYTSSSSSYSLEGPDDSYEILINSLAERARAQERKLQELNI